MSFLNYSFKLFYNYSVRTFRYSVTFPQIESEAIDRVFSFEIDSLSVTSALIHRFNTNYCCAECVKCMYDRDINNAVEFVRFSLAIRFFNLYRARQICCR